MKRKAAISAEALMSENANPGGGSQSGQVNKKRRWVSREFLRDHQQVFFRVRSGFFGEALEESCIDNVAVKRRRARGKRVETSSIASSSQAQEQRELLEEMGVNLLSDNSNSCDSHVPLAVPSFQVGHSCGLNDQNRKL